MKDDFVPSNQDIHGLQDHPYVIQVVQRDNHFVDWSFPLLSMHKRYDQLVEMENNTDLDAMDAEMIAFPDQVVY